MVAIIYINRRILRELSAIYMLFQGVEFLTVKPATTPTTRIPSWPHILPLPFPPHLSISLSVSRTHKFTYVHCSTVSPLPLHSEVQTSYTSVWQVVLNCCVGLRNRCSAGPKWHTALCWSIPVSFFFSLFIFTIPLSLLSVCPFLLSLQKPSYRTSLAL